MSEQTTLEGLFQSPITSPSHVGCKEGSELLRLMAGARSREDPHAFNASQWRNRKETRLNLG